MIYDGADIKYLLEKKGYRYTDVARELGITPQVVFLVARGIKRSQRVTRHIEQLLGIAPGTLEITSEKRDALVKVA